mmetsp:Transcript_61296/g.177795  ORF Transcript_61296/g.177795 Transcript_61296/m.177795 type:complete len:244 (-) Transcript_61296:293-1024(-)
MRRRDSSSALLTSSWPTIVWSSSRCCASFSMSKICKALFASVRPRICSLRRLSSFLRCWTCLSLTSRCQRSSCAMSEASSLGCPWSGFLSNSIFSFSLTTCTAKASSSSDRSPVGSSNATSNLSPWAVGVPTSPLTSNSAVGSTRGCRWSRSIVTSLSHWPRASWNCWRIRSCLVFQASSSRFFSCTIVLQHSRTAETLTWWMARAARPNTAVALVSGKGTSCEAVGAMPRPPYDVVAEKRCW